MARGVLSGIADLAGIGIIAVGGLIFLKAVGGIEGLQNLSKGFGDLFGGLTGSATTQPAQNETSMTGLPLPAAGDLAAAKITQYRNAGLDYCEAELRAFVETGLMDASLFSSALAQCRAQHGTITQAQEQVAQDYYAGEKTIQEVTRVLSQQTTQTRQVVATVSPQQEIQKSGSYQPTQEQVSSGAPGAVGESYDNTRINDRYESLIKAGRTKDAEAYASVWMA